MDGMNVPVYWQQYIKNSHHKLKNFTDTRLLIFILSIFLFMFYLHISIQSLKLVSYIIVECKILQIDEGGASKLKSGKLRNIMIVCPMYLNFKENPLALLEQSSI